MNVIKKGDRVQTISSTLTQSADGLVSVLLAENTVLKVDRILSHKLLIATCLSNASRYLVKTSEIQVIRYEWEEQRSDV